MLQKLPLDVLFQILNHLSPVDPFKVTDHPYLALSLVSSALFHAVESHCLHLLQSLQSSSIITTSSTQRLPYLAHASNHCRFCSTPTLRLAIIHPSIPACRACDNVQWPNKITLEYATKVYGLNGRELIELFSCGPIERRWGKSWMFDENEIQRYIVRVHGDLEKYLKEREEMWEREKQKSAEIDPSLPHEERRRRGLALRGVFRELQELAVNEDDDDDW
ncbi:hypothetical protein BDD12DRAFT_850710 [Trichophaea hybrida]|nr:hypothetical protein BDD12DRAFT_850710 [Trichophaea hybrida]